MPDSRSLSEVLIAARQVAARYHHHYLGVEHLFVALLEPDATPARAQLAAKQIDPEQAIAYLERYTEIDDSRRLWAGHPHTPRADVVLNIAHDLAIEAGRENDVREQDIWHAILEEGESLPVHVLTRLGQQP